MWYTVNSYAFVRFRSCAQEHYGITPPIKQAVIICAYRIACMPRALSPRIQVGTGKRLAMGEAVCYLRVFAGFP